MEPTGPPVLLLAAGGSAWFPGMDGWERHPGFEVDDAPWDLRDRRLVCVGVVDDTTTAAALDLVARGAALAIELQTQGHARHRFLEDLHKLGASVGAHDDAAAGARATAALTPLQQELLDALAAGSTVTAAAEAAHVSRRTANRALADARSRLGVTTNAGAVRRWLASRPPDSAGPG